MVVIDVVVDCSIHLSQWTRLQRGSSDLSPAGPKCGCGFDSPRPVYCNGLVFTWFRSAQPYLFLSFSLSHPLSVLLTLSVYHSLGLPLSVSLSFFLFFFSLTHTHTLLCVLSLSLSLSFTSPCPPSNITVDSFFVETQIHLACATPENEVLLPIFKEKQQQ